jgi:hypothetical protein
MTEDLPSHDDVAAWMAETTMRPHTAEGHRIGVLLPGEAAACLAELARARSVSIETLAAELLTAAVVRCTEAEHGPALAGQVLSRSELDARRRDELESERGRLAAELAQARRIAGAVVTELARFADIEESARRGVPGTAEGIAEERG